MQNIFNVICLYRPQLNDVCNIIINKFIRKGRWIRHCFSESGQECVSTHLEAVFVLGFGEFFQDRQGSRIRTMISCWFDGLLRTSVAIAHVNYLLWPMFENTEAILGMKAHWSNDSCWMISSTKISPPAWDSTAHNQSSDIIHVRDYGHATTSFLLSASHQRSTLLIPLQLSITTITWHARGNLPAHPSITGGA